jgi:HEAT repeat protein
VGQRLTGPEITSADLLTAVRNPAHDPTPTLLVGLKASNAAVREEAAHFLQELPSRLALDGLCDAVRKDSEEAVRWEAAEALGVLGDPAAIPALLSALPDSSPSVRLNVAEALGLIGEGNAHVTHGLCCLLSDRDDFVRRFALEALGNLGDSAAIPAIRTLRPPRACPRMVRVWVFYALARLGAEPFAFGEVLAVLRTGTSAARTSAAFALARIADTESVSRIRRALERQYARESSEGMREVMERAWNELPKGEEITL